MKRKPERVVLVGMGEKYSPDGGLNEHDRLGELKLLAETADVAVVGTLVQPRSEISPRYYIGSGKAAELRELVESLGATTVIFDNDLAPAQVRNLEKLLGVKIIDRSGLILDIFAIRARTREAKIQVELAQLRHILPRLTRQWIHLSRQVGGIGVRGPGETQLEVDRRRVRDRIGHLAQKLKLIEKRGETSRRNRRNAFTVSLIGYTNSGKSTLFNALSRACAPVEDKLFKTLDTMSRRISLDFTPEIILSDTVGFIRDLPHELIASFYSTLTDVQNADLLLHIIDITNPGWKDQRDVVEQVLSEINAGNVKMLTVFNKIDRVGDRTLIKALSTRFPNALFVSARFNEGIGKLKEAITRAALREKVRVTIDIDPENSALLREIYRHGTILDTESRVHSLRLTCALPVAVAHRLGLNGQTGR
ncbi:GTPase HflX [Candidatus Latescibacterota bacterium]